MKKYKLKLAIVGAGFLIGVGLLGITLSSDAVQGGDPAPLQTVPGHLDILYATIEEVAPDYSYSGTNDVPSREVIFRLEVAADPSSFCNPTTTFLGYCFLIDADKDGSTGIAHPEFGTLGIDARICIECDPGSGTFSCPLGPVNMTIDPGTGATVIEVLTTISQLPSIDFNWIAAAQHETAFVRLPELPEYKHWTTIERSLY